MFPLNCLEAVRATAGSAGYSYIGCVSFEPRWANFCDQAHGDKIEPNAAFVIFPIDKGSRYESECRARQEEAWRGSIAHLVWRSQRSDVVVAEGAPWHVVRQVLHQAVPPGGEPKTIVIDITTMPRVCYFPLIADAMRLPEVRNVVVVYSEAGKYRPGNLESEPTIPMAVPPLDRFPASGGRKIRVGWIPILGFDPLFAILVYKSLVDSYDLSGGIYPMIGFPGFQPGYFERVVNDSARAILSEATGNGLRDQFLYAAAGDPFETRDTILTLIGASGSDVHWVGTPVGPKPMALGILLAALSSEMSIVVSQARTYHPDYSVGCGSSYGYVIKRDGVAI